MGIIPNSCQEHVNDSRSINTVVMAQIGGFMILAS